MHEVSNIHASDNSYSQGHLKKSIQEIIDRGKLIVGVCKVDQPPFYYRNHEGKLKGIDIDIAKGLADDLGVHLEINQEAQNWDELVEQLHRKKIDLAISFLSKTTSRGKSILYSNTYAKGSQSLLINRLRLSKAQAKGFKSLKEIFSKNSGEVLLAYEGSSYLKFARVLFPDANIVTYSSQKELYTALLSGKYIALITDQLEVRTFLEHSPDQKLTLLPLAIRDHSDLIAIGSNSNNESLIDYVNNYLEINNIKIDISTLRINGRSIGN